MRRCIAHCISLFGVSGLFTYPTVHLVLQLTNLLFSGNTYVTVGSHSGFISTLQLDKESYIPTFRTRLPDRIEASVLILDGFKGIVGKFCIFQKIHSCLSIPRFAGCYDGNVYCLHLKTGEVFWKYQTGDIVKCSAIFCKERTKVFVGSYDCYVYCLSAKVNTCFTLRFSSLHENNF